MTLIQATKIIGLKIITLDGGREIDTVKDVIYDPEENRVKALLIDKQGWFKDAKIVSVENIRSIGQDAVIVQDEEAIESASDNSARVANIAHDKNYLTKTKIITVDGDDLGSITDLYFSLPDGNVQEFEVSGGLISDLKSGRNMISVADIVTIGQDATIVKTYAEVKIEDQNKNQGVQGVATNAAGIAGIIGDKAKDVWESTKNKAGEAKEYVDSGKFKSDTDNLVEGMKTKAKEIQEGLSPKIEDMKDKAQDFGSDIKDKAKNIVSKAQNTIDAKRDEIDDDIESELKYRAIGKYLKTDILDQYDEIIGSVGDIVTQEMIDEAEENDQLSILLDNLSEEPIEMNTNL